MVDGTAGKALRNAEAALNKALQREKKELVAAYRQQISEIAHDMKNPLNGLIAYSQIMAEDAGTPLEPEIFKKYASIVHKTSLRLLQICETLLANHRRPDEADDGRKSGGGPDPNVPQTVKAEELMEEITDTFQALAQKRGIDVKSEIDGEFPDLHAVPLDLNGLSPTSCPTPSSLRKETAR